MKIKKKYTTRQIIRFITTTGIMSALAFVSLFLVQFPIIPSAPFLMVDIKDVFITLAGFIYGPLEALLVVLLTSLLQFITSPQYTFYGLVMNLISSGSFCIIASFIYSKKKDWLGALLGLLAGTLLMTIDMGIANYFITPYYMNITKEAIAPMIWSAFVPFNLIKAAINSAIIFVISLPLQKITKYVLAKDIEREEKKKLNTISDKDKTDNKEDKIDN